MGGMSASDAAPLPRLGEVFFDVRGNSRSMRLSWYADTGVAVLSIWQGGMCTGTFRLAIADLPRMVETLQRGPGGQRREWDAEAPGEVFAQVPRMATGQGEAMEPLPGQRWPDLGAREAEYQTGAAPYQTSQRQAPQRQAARRPTAQYPPEPGGLRTGTAGAPRAETTGYLAGPPDQRTVPPGVPPVAPEYLAELPDDPRTGATPQLTEPPEYLPAPPDRRTVPPGRGAASPGRHTSPGHAAAPPDPLTGSLDPLTGPPDPLTWSPDPLTGLPDPLTGPSGYQAQPPDQRTDYLADLPGAGPAEPAGYDGSLSAGGLPEASNPLADATGPFPGDTATGPYPRDPGREVLADDPYLGGTDPLDYPGSQYPPGTSAPGPGDVPGRATGDYPAHYGSDAAEDVLPGPAPDSAPYDRPQGRRRAANRHAAPDMPFD
jgi:hypothetical protein